jgi:pimeloyl-ACP methyl ester carboxylesterase
MEIKVDDRTVFAATGGRAFDAAAPCVVFVHGAGMDHSVWSLQVRYFAHHGRSLLAVDLPGHGHTEGDVPAAIEPMADWILRMLDAAGVEKAALVGHSMGALVSLEAAARGGDRIGALALLGVAAPMRVHPALLEAAEANGHRAVDMIVSWGHGRKGSVGGQPAPGLWLAGGSARLLERSGPGVLHAGLKACNDYTGALAAADGVRCPALLVHGETDRMTPPKAARDLAEHLADVRTEVIADCGHMMMREGPHATTEALRRLI